MFKGSMSLCIAAMLSLRENDDPNQLLTDTMTVFDNMKALKFHASDYLTVAAYLIASNTDRQNYQRTVGRAREFYEGMKKQQWFYTGQDDYIYPAMLGLSDIDPVAGTQRIEQLYQRLKDSFGSGGNSLQALCHCTACGNYCGYVRKYDSSSQCIELGGFYERLFKNNTISESGNSLRVDGFFTCNMGALRRGA